METKVAGRMINIAEQARYKRSFDQDGPKTLNTESGSSYMINVAERTKDLQTSATHKATKMSYRAKPRQLFDNQNGERNSPLRRIVVDSDK